MKISIKNKRLISENLLLEMDINNAQIAFAGLNTNLAAAETNKTDLLQYAVELLQTAGILNLKNIGKDAESLEAIVQDFYTKATDELTNVRELYKLFFEAYSKYFSTVESISDIVAQYKKASNTARKLDNKAIAVINEISDCLKPISFDAKDTEAYQEIISKLTEKLNSKYIQLTKATGEDLGQLKLIFGLMDDSTNDTEPDSEEDTSKTMSEAEAEKKFAEELTALKEKMRALNGVSASEVKAANDEFWNKWFTYLAGVAKRLGSKLEEAALVNKFISLDTEFKKCLEAYGISTKKNPILHFLLVPLDNVQLISESFMHYATYMVIHNAFVKNTSGIGAAMMHKDKYHVILCKDLYITYGEYVSEMNKYIESYTSADKIKQEKPKEFLKIIYSLDEADLAKLNPETFTATDKKLNNLVAINQSLATAGIEQTKTNTVNNSAVTDIIDKIKDANEAAIILGILLLAAENNAMQYVNLSKETLDSIYNNVTQALISDNKKIQNIKAQISGKKYKDDVLETFVKQLLDKAGLAKKETDKSEETN